ncbi:tyrosine-type recombinase/integrase [Haloglomus halophilum]|uniref:tyrosine-type recombinase/integrase n=1 Tax=Haloglomus halophilum TaxID=2962672 RepID=UPI0020C9DA85|nr:site-specific integrase [Haloglomus halophilum]
MPNSLEPISPDEAVQFYLNNRQTELADGTLESYRYKLTHFVEWCEADGIENLNELSGRDILRFKQSRQDDLAPVSLKAQMDALRAFIRFAESIDAVEQDLHSKVLSPSLDRGDRERDVLVEEEQAEAALDYYRQFHYASRQHTTLTLLWKCGARTGTLRAFDLGDYDPENARLLAKHRDGTPLKNKQDGERLIALSDDTCQVLNDYIQHHREDVMDENGRDPLLTTKHGRVSKPTIRATCYRGTHPCRYNGGHCPHGRDPDECQALNPPEKAPSVCPSTRSPHAWRRGAITYHLTEDVPIEVVSDRMNVSPDVLEAHYDRRSEEVKVEQRREYLEGV